MSKYSLILFDFDGTIANTDDVIAESMFELYDAYRDGKRTPKEEIYYFSGPPIKGTLAKEFPHMDLEFIFNEFHQASVRNYPKYLKNFPGCKEFLGKLKDNGYKLGIVTNKVHSSTDYCVSLLGMEGIFDTIVAYDDVINKKPHKEPMLKAMKELGITDLSQVLYVGDNESDLECANNASVDCALVDFGPRKLKPNLKPKFKFKTFEQLWEDIYHE